ncbi:hypothetical protein MASR2M78_01000 [Treponema sp.]
MFSLFLVQILLSIVTLGIYAPWAISKIYSYLASHLKWGQEVFALELSGGRLFSLYLKGILLSIITLGIYSAWFEAELDRYYAECASLNA